MSRFASAVNLKTVEAIFRTVPSIRSSGRTWAGRVKTALGESDVRAA